MSKIYEALLRAELERTVITGEPANGAAVAVHDLLIPADEGSYAMDSLETAEYVYAEPVLPPQAPVDPSAPLDVSNVKKCSWQPKLSAPSGPGDRRPGVEPFPSLPSHIRGFRDQRPLKTLLVSSGLPGEGKSFVTLNLALSFARHKGNRVLLIDGDMRRSSLHKVLGAPHEPGLAEYLAGEADLLDVMQQPRATPGVVLPPGLSSLTFIGGGRDADNAGDLAANSRFAELIAAVSPAFDWVIVDSSPVNLVSDAVSLAPVCDGVLLVCREGVTRFKTAQQAQAQFKSANVLGFVLNAVHKLPKGDYYGTYDSYKAEA